MQATAVPKWQLCVESYLTPDSRLLGKYLRNTGSYNIISYPCHTLPLANNLPKGTESPKPGTVRQKLHDMIFGSESADKPGIRRTATTLQVLIRPVRRIHAAQDAAHTKHASK
eukprot:gnl/TRDRNA2_/TRDRNA2_125994_c2_seq1.p2 gnl/TRDRNA2_/TRDRNA2_125994_c2~~gnl/TRDRNA2_/TRDRNA2_125994_c2_seq1.p2  ORF type:complete len:113 (-),score=13.35 gnl/TRDRNA2_/TRDRNA2_125994_c2_seq1:78-416(-)